MLNDSNMNDVVKVVLNSPQIIQQNNVCKKSVTEKGGSNEK